MYTHEPESFSFRKKLCFGLRPRIARRSNSRQCAESMAQEKQVGFEKVYLADEEPSRAASATSPLRPKLPTRLPASPACLAAPMPPGTAGLAAGYSPVRKNQQAVTLGQQTATLGYQILTTPSMRTAPVMCAARRCSPVVTARANFTRLVLRCIETNFYK